MIESLQRIRLQRVRGRLDRRSDLGRQVGDFTVVLGFFLLKPVATILEASLATQEPSGYASGPGPAWRQTNESATAPV